MIKTESYRINTVLKFNKIIQDFFVGNIPQLTSNSTSIF